MIFNCLSQIQIHLWSSNRL